MEWYNSLSKPQWTPEPAFIGTMWSILYPIILITFIYVFIQVFRQKIARKVAIPFVLNLIANLAFTPIQFGLRNMPLASLDILLIWGTIIWMVLAIWKYNRFIAIAQIPYFLWVSVATILQLTITWMNF
jgi:tryptophan-rich sensory protein